MQDLFVFSVHTYIIASTSHIDDDKFIKACHRRINRNECKIWEHYFTLIFLTDDQQDHKLD